MSKVQAYTSPLCTRGLVLANPPALNMVMPLCLPASADYPGKNLLVARRARVQCVLNPGRTNCIHSVTQRIFAMRLCQSLRALGRFPPSCTASCQITERKFTTVAISHPHGWWLHVRLRGARVLCRWRYQYCGSANTGSNGSRFVRLLAQLHEESRASSLPQGSRVSHKALAIKSDRSFCSAI